MTNQEERYCVALRVDEMTEEDRDCLALDSKPSSTIIRDGADNLYHILLWTKDMTSLQKYSKVLRISGLVFGKYTVIGVLQAKDVYSILTFLPSIKSTLEIERVAKKRETTRSSAIEEARSILTTLSVHSARDLIALGVEQVEKILTLKRTGTILGKTLKCSIALQDIVTLSNALGRDLHDGLRTWLGEHGIVDQKTLIDYGQHAFVETFGLKWIGIINGKQSRADRPEIIALGEKLGWSLKHTIKQLLAEKNIYTGLDLLKADKNDLEKLKKYIGKLRGKTVNVIPLQQRFRLCESLYLYPDQDIALHIKKHIPIVNFSAPIMWQTLEGLGLRKNMTIVIEHFQPQIDEMLGYSVLKYVAAETTMVLKKQFDIKDKASFLVLDQKVVRDFLGLKKPGFLLGRTLYDLNKKDKSALADVLYLY